MMVAPQQSHSCFVVAAVREHPLSPSDAHPVSTDIFSRCFSLSIREVIPRGFFPGFGKSSLLVMFSFNLHFVQDG